MGSAGGGRVEAHARTLEVSWSGAPARPRKSLPSGSLERGTLGGRGLYERVQMRNVSAVCVVMPFPTGQDKTPPPLGCRPPYHTPEKVGTLRGRQP